MATHPISVLPARIACGIFALIALAICATGVRAQDALEKGLKVGQTIPLDMTASDQYGTVHSLKSLIGRTGLILLFNRSFDW